MTPAVIERIEADLRQEWSPEQIAGRLAADDSLRCQRISSVVAICGTVSPVGLAKRIAVVVAQHLVGRWRRVARAP